MEDGAVGTLSENLDAMLSSYGIPTPSGTFSQAWSVSELVRMGFQSWLGLRFDLPEHRVFIEHAVVSTQHSVRNGQRNLAINKLTTDNLKYINMATSKRPVKKQKNHHAPKTTQTGGTPRRRKDNAQGSKKNFILDTNVILHDYNCLDNFEENDIYIPFIVLEELDKFKKGNEQINFNARAFVRELDLITDDDLFTNGAELGVGKGKLYIVNASHDNKRISDAFPEKTPDNQILAVVAEVAEKHPDMKTILVSKDINLRMKARSLGMLAEDYINDKVTNIDIFNQGELVIEGIDPEIIDRIYAQARGRYG